MNKLSRVALWGGLFVVTMSLAIGLSLFALRVRAAVDAGREKTRVIPLMSGDTLSQPQSVELQSGTTPTDRQFEQSECALPGNADPTGQTAAPPTVDIPGQTYRDCCGVLRWVPTPVASLLVEPGSPAGPTPEATPSCH